ncbi:hypothetical protein Drorol1_Dr00010507 [Drosera rotundifolia]
MLSSLRSPTPTTLAQALIFDKQPRASVPVTRYLFVGDEYDQAEAADELKRRRVWLFMQRNRVEATRLQLREQANRQFQEGRLRWSAYKRRRRNARNNNSGDYVDENDVPGSVMADLVLVLGSAISELCWLLY